MGRRGEQQVDDIDVGVIHTSQTFTFKGVQANGTAQTQFGSRLLLAFSGVADLTQMAAAITGQSPDPLVAARVVGGKLRLTYDNEVPITPNSGELLKRAAQAEVREYDGVYADAIGVDQIGTEFTFGTTAVGYHAPGSAKIVPASVVTELNKVNTTAAGFTFAQNANKVTLTGRSSGRIPVTLTLQDAVDFSANNLTAGMTVTQGTSPNFTAEGTIRTAVTGSTTTIVVDVTAGTFASTADTSIDGAASGAVKFVAATNLKAVSLELTRHASVQYKLVTGANSENSATYDFGGAVGRYEFPFHCKGDATGVILRDCNQFSDFAGCSRDNSLKNVQVGSSAFNTTTDSVLLMFKKDESSSTTLLRRVAQPTKMSINMTGENPTTARNQTSYTLERPFNGTQTIDTSRDVRDMDDLVNTMNAEGRHGERVFRYQYQPRCGIQDAHGYAEYHRRFYHHHHHRCQHGEHSCGVPGDGSREHPEEYGRCQCNEWHDLGSFEGPDCLNPQ